MYKRQFQHLGGHHAGEADAEFIVDVDNIRVECLDQLEAAVANGRGDAVIAVSYTHLVGIWVMRMADSVLLTCWPPAPPER